MTISRPERAYLFFLLPSALVVAVVLLFPLGYAVYLSFFRYFMGREDPAFIGLANYTTLLSDVRTLWALVHTLVIVVASVALQFALGFVLAYGMFRLTRGGGVAATLNFIPHIVTPVVGALFMKWMFAGRWGLIDGLLTSVGITPPNWLGDPAWAMATVILADTWRFAPFMTLVLYAGLQAMDQSILEAAAVDGAGGWAMIYRVILPALKPIILFVLAIRTMDAVRYFDIIYVLTGGGPGTATETLTTYTYVLGFRALEIGKASALGVLTLALILLMMTGLISWIYRRERGDF
jgi:multiple sugar transport system permease protein